MHARLPAFGLVAAAEVETGRVAEGPAQVGVADLFVAEALSPVLGVGLAGYGFALPRSYHDVVPGIIILTGLAMLPLSILPLLVGVVALFRKLWWGRVLMFVLPALFILYGGIFLFDDTLGATRAWILFGSTFGVHAILYGILTFEILKRKTRKFPAHGSGSDGTPS